MVESESEAVEVEMAGRKVEQRYGSPYEEATKQMGSKNTEVVRMAFDLGKTIWTREETKEEIEGESEGESADETQDEEIYQVGRTEFTLGIDEWKTSTYENTCSKLKNSIR